MQSSVKSMLSLVLFFFMPVFCLPVQAQIDLAVLTENAQIQAFIYNSADLTLIKDTRTLYFDKGTNQVRFSWTDTRIDPTSLSLDIKDGALPVKIALTQFPPEAKNQVIWHVRADQACRAQVDISYFTSGIFWQSYYTAFLSQDRSTMHLTGQVRVENRSGIDYLDAQIFLVVGKIHLLDRIADLADQPFPYGKPQIRAVDNRYQEMTAKGKALLESAPAMKMQQSMDMAAPEKIEKTRASEYFVYAVEGKKNLTHGWARQLVFADAPAVRADTIHVSDFARFGDRVIQMVSFTNDSASGLGPVPLPGGAFKMFQKTDPAGGLIFAGTDTAGYIPAGQKHLLNLGADPRVTVVPRVMKYAKANLTFDKQNNLSGFDEVRTMAIDLANFSDRPARIEIFRTAQDSDFTITRISGHDKFEKIDQTRFKFFVTLSQGSQKTIHYTITTYKGDRKWQHAPVPSS